MRQYYQEDQATIVEVDAAEQAFERLIGNKVVSWYRVTGSLIDIKLGRSFQEIYQIKDQTKTFAISEYHLEIGGRWSISDSGKEIISDYDGGETIDKFIEKTSLGSIIDVILTKDKISIFIDFSCGLTLQIIPDKETYTELEWVNLHIFSQYALRLVNDSTKKFKKVPIILK